MEGHAALRIVHPRYGDFTVNWGVFDFDSPGFVYRFVKGETDYMAAGADTRHFAESYRRQGRTVKEIVLRLDSAQIERLTGMVMTNLLPENRVYRYNYVLDNCATRPLAMIEAAIGDTITLASHGLPGNDGDTFRNVMRYYHRNYPWYQFGIDTALGSGIDRPISVREASFAPVVLEKTVEEAMLPSGEQLVTEICYIVGSDDTPPVVSGPTPWYISPMTCAIAVLAITLWVSIMQLKGREQAVRWFDTAYFSLLGLEGLLLSFLIFVSVHEATSPNWLYLWLNPLCFIGAVTPWLKSSKRLEICYQCVNFALLIVLTVILLAGIQSPNPAFIPLMMASVIRAVTTIYSRCLKVKTSR